MKLKNIDKILPISLGITLFLRIVQEIFLTDSFNGFIKHEYSVIGGIITVVIFILVAFSAFVAYKTPRIPKKVLKPNLPIGIVSLILSLITAFGLLAESFIVSTPAWQLFVVNITGISATLFFAFYGARAFFKFPFSSVFYIAPLLYYTAKLVAVFTAMTTMVPAMDHSLLLGAYCAQIVFFFELSKKANDAEEKNSHKKIFVSAVLQIIFSAAYSLPSILALFAGKTLHEEFTVVVEVLCSGIFTLLFVLRHFGRANCVLDNNGLTNDR